MNATPGTVHIHGPVHVFKCFQNLPLGSLAPELYSIAQYAYRAAVKLALGMVPAIFVKK